MTHHSFLSRSVLIAMFFYCSNGLHAQSSLSFYNIEEKNPVSFKLPAELKEISGLTTSDDGRIFCHDDEKGTVYHIDPQTGLIIKQFSLGPKTVKEDFEAIAIVKDKFYLTTSAGVLYEFNEGKNDERVKYNVYETGLKQSNDVEGMCYDPETNSLLLACKDHPGKGYDGYRSVYSFSLKKMKLEKQPRFLLPLKNIEAPARHGIFKPSEITRHPKTGTFFILASRGESIIEISREGKILAQATFPKGVHPQPEGMTFTSDNTLLISDEGYLSKAKLTRYGRK